MGDNVEKLRKMLTGEKMRVIFKTTKDKQPSRKGAEKALVVKSSKEVQSKGNVNHWQGAITGFYITFEWKPVTGNKRREDKRQNG